MESLYKMLLKSKYYLKDYYGSNAFVFAGENKEITIQKKRKNYIVTIFDNTGMSEVEFKTTKEVAEYLGIQERL